MNGKECRFHLLYDLGDGGLETKNVCAYFQNWHHDDPSTPIYWVPTKWWWWILSLKDVKGWEHWLLFSSKGPCLYSDWNGVAKVRLSSRRGNEPSLGLNDIKVHREHLMKISSIKTLNGRIIASFICMEKIEARNIMWTREWAVDNILRNSLSFKFLTYFVP